MKHLILTLALVFTSIFSFSQSETEGVTITVTIDNVKNERGKVMMALHDKSTFMRGQGIQNLETKIEGEKVTLSFKNVKAGTYAIIALHDENENNQMDYRDNGMPLEYYGVSNNSMSFGPPQFSDAQFKVEDKDLELNIRF